MDDINFDELDKAVNSALQQTTSKEEPVQNESAPIEKEQRPSQSGASGVPVRSPAVVVRRGQFMDMVHPSSDMTTPAAPARMNRQAAPIQPLNPAIVETMSRDTPQERMVTAEPPMPVQTEVISSNTSADSDPEATMTPEWPDPLDVMEKTQTEREQDEISGVAEVASEFTELDEQSAQSELEVVQEEQPAGSPFIEGAELEKRPLGAFADTGPASSEGAVSHGEEPSVVAEAGKDDVTKAAEDNKLEELPEVPTPDELAPEVVSVESDNPDQISSEGDSEAVTDESVAQETGGLVASIAPQYKNPEEPSDDHANHPVFDTKEYHQPLTPPVKKGHGGIVTLLVLVLLSLLGAGAWYAIAVLKLI